MDNPEGGPNMGPSVATPSDNQGSTTSATASSTDFSNLSPMTEDSSAPWNLNGRMAALTNASEASPPASLKNSDVLEEETLKIAASPSAQLFYDASDKEKKNAVLLAMCIGMEPSNRAYCVIAEDKVYTSVKNKAPFRYNKKILQEEMKRRHRLSANKELKCDSYTISRAINWLLEHPVTDPVEVGWLRATEQSFRASVLEAKNSPVPEAKKDANEKDAEESWTHQNAYLRLIHVICDDTVRPLYLTKDKWENREGTDARNSDNRPPTVFEKAAQLYNDPSFVAVTNAYPHLNQAFAQRHTITSTSEGVPQNVSPDKIKNVLANNKPKLFKMISNWELSGNGNGMRTNTQSSFGHIERVDKQLWLNTNLENDDEDVFIDGDNRSSFLGKNKPHLLYWWEMMDLNDILSPTLNRLDTSVAANSTQVPSVAAASSGRASRRVSIERERDAREERMVNAQENMVETQKQYSSAVSSLATIQLHRQLCEYNEQFMKICREIREEDDEDVLEVLRDSRKLIRNNIHKVESAIMLKELEHTTVDGSSTARSVGNSTITTKGSLKAAKNITPSSEL